MTRLVAQLPWVTRLEHTQDCDGYRYNHMPLKALGDPVIRAKYKCKARARWQFRALPESERNPLPSASGTYCWRHLFTQMRHLGPEETRYQRKMAVLKALADWNTMLLGSAQRLALFW